MPKGDKYIPLKQYLIHLNQYSIKLSFEEIEKIIQDNFPPAAYKHSVWWSNNYDYSQAIAWIDTGYRTNQVFDTKKHRYIDFCK